MTASTSIWRPYRPSQLTQSSVKPLDIVRQALFSLAAAQATGFAPGWSYTNSVTRGEASPGTAAQPARSYMYYGTGNSKQWLKKVCTYTGSVLTKAAFYYSNDNEASYVPMYNEDNANYVLTLTYDGSNNLQSTSWGNTP
jgi:hypothetical protein